VASNSGQRRATDRWCVCQTESAPKKCGPRTFGFVISRVHFSWRFSASFVGYLVWKCSSGVKRGSRDQSRMADAVGEVCENGGCSRSSCIVINWRTELDPAADETGEWAQAYVKRYSCSVCGMCLTIPAILIPVLAIGITGIVGSATAPPSKPSLCEWSPETIAAVVVVASSLGLWFLVVMSVAIYAITLDCCLERACRVRNQQIGSHGTWHFERVRANLDEEDREIAGRFLFFKNDSADEGEMVELEASKGEGVEHESLDEL
jgi:hypothetical protein